MITAGSANVAAPATFEPNLVPVRTAATFDDRAELTPKQLWILDGAERIMERVSWRIHYHRPDLRAVRREV
jgi:hypothetical protein